MYVLNSKAKVIINKKLIMLLLNRLRIHGRNYILAVNFALRGGNNSHDLIESHCNHNNDNA